MFNFDDLYGEICKSKAFVDFATAGKHCWLSFVYFRHNLFHQSILGWDVEFQYTHIVLNKTLRDVMQDSRFSAQLGLGSELNIWYRDATSVPCDHSMSDLLPRTDDRLRFCTKSESLLSKFFIPDRLIHYMSFFYDEHIKYLHCPSVPIIFPQNQKSSLQTCPKQFIWFLSEWRVSLLEGNLQSMKRHHAAKFQNNVRLFSLRRITWKQKRDVLTSERGLRLKKVVTPSVISHFSWYGAVFRRPVPVFNNKSVNT